MQGDAAVSSFAVAPPSDWYAARWRVRLSRRLALSVAGPAVRPVLRRLRPDLADDASAWAAVRSAVRHDEWRRLTRTSYSVLCYHRLAGAGVAGQERIDVPPARFAAHLRTLDRLGFRPITLAEALSTHRGEPVGLGRRRYLLTADDGFADCVAELARLDVGHAWMFVPTAATDGGARWAQDTPVASWEDLHGLVARGVTIGSHGRTHTPLTDLEPDRLRDELVGSLDDLRGQGIESTVLAYPNGRHDDDVRDAARSAGYDLAFTTEPGRNSPATDPYGLRRVTPKSWDSRVSVVFKVLTGEPLPARWEARRRRSHEARRRRRARLRARTANLAPARRFRLQLAARAMEDAVGARPGVRVLDAGCQDGMLARSLAARRPDWVVVGADRDVDAVRSGREIAGGDGLTNVTFLVEDLCRPATLPLFDVVAAMECLAEIPDDIGALRAMADALVPGGLLLLHVPEAEWKPVLRGSARDWDFSLRHGYRADEIRHLLEAAGLVDIRISPTSRAVLQAAQELRDRYVRGRGIKARLLAFPLMAAAVRLELAGITGGQGRALFARARKP